MDTLDAMVRAGLTALGSGTASFLVAFAQFKRRIRVCEDALKEITEKQLPGLAQQYANLTKGWRFELDSFKGDLRRDLEHCQELHAERDRMRDSFPDHTEDLRRDIELLRADIERLKARDTKYVRADTFAAFTKSQEDQWRATERTLGRLEEAVTK